MRTVLLPLGLEQWSCLGRVSDELAREAEAAVIAMTGSAGGIETVRSADLRYRGQSFELTVPLEGGAKALAVSFHAAHERSFGHSEAGAAIEVVSLRASAIRPAPPIAMSRRPAPAHFAVAQGSVALSGGAASLFDRATLDPGAECTGPAIVTQADCTVLIPRSWTARVDGFGNLEMVRG